MARQAGWKRLCACVLAGALLFPFAASTAVVFDEPGVERAPGSFPVGLEVLELGTGNIQLSVILDEAFTDDIFATITLNLGTALSVVTPGGISAPAPYNTALLPIFPGTEKTLFFSFPIGADLTPGPIVSWVLQAPPGTNWSVPVTVTGLVESGSLEQEIGVSATIAPTPVPEPGIAVLLASGLLLTVLSVCRRQSAPECKAMS